MVIFNSYVNVYQRVRAMSKWNPGTISMEFALETKLNVFCWRPVDRHRIGSSSDHMKRTR